MSESPLNSPANSPRLSPTINIPHLPWNVIRRIIHFRLALTPSIPCRLDPDGPVTIAWDGMVGRIGMKARQKRVEERKYVAAAVGLLRVCKSWRNIILRYLYTEPHLTDSNFFSFCRAILAGDKKWDDLRVHPHSVPGRYVSTLDLSGLTRFSDGPRSVARALRELLTTCPNITHIRLPPYHPSKDGLTKALLDAPCLGKLRVLENLQIQSAPTREISLLEEEDAFTLLSPCRLLEYLSIDASGFVDIEYHRSIPPLRFPKLHTLEIGEWTGGILHIFDHDSLPQLQALRAHEDYFGPPSTGTFAQSLQKFKNAYGHQLVSLTVLPSAVWFEDLFPWSPGRVVDDHPNLRHFSILRPPFTAVGNEPENFTSGLHRSGHPLSHITLHKWNHPEEYPSTRPPGNSATLLQAEGPLGNLPRTPEILEALAASRPSNLTTITIDGNTWVSTKLGRAALSTGISAEMRSWSSKLKTHGLILRDMEGNEAPREGEGENGTGRGRRLSRNNDQRMDRALWDPYRGATRRALSRMQGDDQDGG